jgi:TolA-binding protein
MTHRAPVFRLALACVSACALAHGAANADPAAVPANPPAKQELGGAAAGGEELKGLIRLGGSLTDRGDYPTAEIAFWQVLRKPDASLPDQDSALLGLAHLYRKEGALTKAAAIYERFLKDHPDEDRVPDALLELGRTLRDMGVYRLALNRFYSVINSTLKFPAQGFEHYEQLAKTAQFEIAQTHFEAGEYDQASKYFLKVRLLDLAPSDRARAHFMAAFSENLAGEKEAAVTTLRSFLDEWPEDSNVPEARYLLATILRELKRPQEALAVTLQLLKEEHGRGLSDPNRWSYWQRRTGNEVANEFFQSGDVFNALGVYQGLVALSPEPSWKLPVTYQIALCYERLGQLDRAREAYQAVIAGAGTSAGAASEPSDLARMATWRLAHLSWRDNIDRQFTSLLNLNHDATGSAPAAPPHL